MRTDFVFYYFAPLVSFWFSVVYFTLGMGQGNLNATFVIRKVAMPYTLTTTFIKISGFLEFIFLLKLFLGLSWPVEE